MGRKSIWDNVQGQTPEPAPALTVLDQIPTAKQKAKDQRQREPVATFYGIPAETHERLLRLADGLGVPAGEAARFFFERGLLALTANELELRAQLCEGKRTLYPTWGAKPVKTAGRRGKKGKGKQDDKRSYRGVPAETKAELARVADERAITIGELARFLLEWGLDEQAAGRLEMATYAASQKWSLFGATE